MATRGTKKSSAKTADKTDKEASCGLIMPISLIDGCPPDHWLEVKAIVTEAVDSVLRGLGAKET